MVGHTRGWQLDQRTMVHLLVLPVPLIHLPPLALPPKYALRVVTEGGLADGAPVTVVTAKEEQLEKAYVWDLNSIVPFLPHPIIMGIPPEMSWRCQRDKFTAPSLSTS